MPKIRKITLKDAECIAHRLAKRHMDWNEPIPDFSTRFPHKLESCLETPFMGFGKKILYRGVISKAAILFYLIIKNHPFQNGNKRMAVTMLLVFLSMNNKWLIIGAKQFYNFAIWVAESPANLKEDTIRAIETFLKQHVKDI